MLDLLNALAYNMLCKVVKHLATLTIGRGVESMKSRTQQRREKRQEELEKVQLLNQRFNIVVMTVTTIVVVIELIMKML